MVQKRDEWNQLDPLPVYLASAPCGGAHRAAVLVVAHVTHDQARARMHAAAGGSKVSGGGCRAVHTCTHGKEIERIVSIVIILELPVGSLSLLIISHHTRDTSIPWFFDSFRSVCSGCPFAALAAAALQAAARANG